MNQRDNPEEFFEKYGFRLDMTINHPDFNEPMHFDGLEANYVNRLEREIKELRKFIDIQNGKLDYLMNKEFYTWKRAKKPEEDV